jgi:hypothetical protein
VVLEKDGDISWTDGLRNEEGLGKIYEERNDVYVIKRRKASSIGPSCLGTAF